MSFVHVAKSADLTSEVIDEAARSPQAAKQLMQRIAEIARPEEGWARFFKLAARLTSAEWLEGELEVDLAGDTEQTTVAFYAVLGLGIRERLFAPVTLALPIDELQRATLLSPERIAPLRAKQGLGQLTLARASSARGPEVPDFELEDKALGDNERITAPPPPLAELAALLNGEDVPPDVFTRSTKPPPPR